MSELQADSETGNAVAILAMACRVPGASSVSALWRNLCAGQEAITRFSRAELLAAGHEPALIDHPDYVPLNRIVADAELFDAAFFGFTPREAELLDPQQRLFLECAHQALEAAGYGAREHRPVVGVYAGGTTSSYLLSCLLPSAELRRTQGVYQLFLHNEKDFLPTRVSYKLDLRGPSVNVQTACSTSLVAVHLACQALLDGDCELALAGGASIRVPQQAGYLYQKDMIFSPDGRSRAFDAQAAGTVAGDGVGVVVLKRLDAALADGDPILAVIRGSAVNNDGAGKIGYTAPSVEGQARVIREALAVAGVSAESISYVEAHGTATPLGDPIELAALSRVFAAGGEHRCALGALKNNLGHMDAAAGVGGLIKTVLMLQHRTLPPCPSFQQPNPKLDLARSPFYISTQLSPWPAGAGPRRAGVSAFGIGGTNAHLVLEEAPAVPAAAATSSAQLLTLSAKTQSALTVACRELAEHLEQDAQSLADVAYTLHVGREPHAFRCAVVANDRATAAAKLREVAPVRAATAASSIAFMFPGGGAQYPQMARELYATEAVFRTELDRCAALLQSLAGLDLQGLLFADSEPGLQAQRLQRPLPGLTCLFAVEYALARQLVGWGITPQLLLGHSLGEYVAACLAGVFSLEDALLLVVRRGQLFETLPAGGAMLSVPLAEAELRPLLGESLAIAAINTPSSCTVSGARDALQELDERLGQRGILSRRIHLEVAAHSPAVDAILGPFAAAVRRIALQPPQIPILSNLTGALLTAAQATDPQYWVSHLRSTVRFADGLAALFGEPVPLVLEVGPGNTLASLARQHPSYREQTILTTVRHPSLQQSDVAFLLQTVGALWTGGARIDWQSFHAHEPRRRVPLPTYPFERQRYFVPPPATAGAATAAPAPAMLARSSDPADFFYLPLWQQTVPSAPDDGAQLRVLLLADAGAFSSALAAQLSQRHRVTRVQAGERFAGCDFGFTLNPREPADYLALGQALAGSAQRPDLIVHAFSLTPPSGERTGEAVVAAQERGLYSLLALTQMLDQRGWTDGLRVAVLSRDLHRLTGEEPLCPEQATLTGWLTTAPYEYPGLRCRSIDLHLPEEAAALAALAAQLGPELTGAAGEPRVAYRGHQRLVPSYQPVRIPATERADLQGVLRPRGVYLITGGLGGIGLALARQLAARVQARLVLVSRTALPPQEQWARLLAEDSLAAAPRRVVRQLHELVHLGAEVLTLAADVADRAAMAAALLQARARFGAIHGVIHAAGVPGGGVMLRQSRESIARTLAPKVQGTLVLDELFAQEPLDFMVLCSALVTVVGAFGHLDYAAANGFLDAFAQARTARRGQRTVSINWNRWQDLGMAVAIQAQHEALSGHALPGGLSAEEGFEVLLRILGSRALRLALTPQVIVSSEELAPLMQAAAAARALPAPPPLAAGKRAGGHPRPALSTAYVAVQGATERRLATIMEGLLGVEPIGSTDNFFELGGNSLVGTRLIAQAREAFGLELALRDLFEAPTVAKLAQRIEAAGLVLALKPTAGPLGAPPAGPKEQEEGWL